MMMRSRLNGKNGRNADSLEDSENFARLLVAFSEKRDTPALIAYLADDRTRLLLCKALVSPITDSDRALEQRARRIMRSRGIVPEDLKERLEPAAFALGLGSTCDFQTDYYDVLGVNTTATVSELKTAYRKKAFALHPDTAGQSAEDSREFVTVKTAYDTLVNPERRAAFDQCRTQVDSWHEVEAERIAGGRRVGRQPSVRFRRIFLRVAVVIIAMVVAAWAISVFYEREAMLELAQVTPPDQQNVQSQMAESKPPELEREVSAASILTSEEPTKQERAFQQEPPKTVVAAGPESSDTSDTAGPVTEKVPEEKVSQSAVPEKPQAPEPIHSTPLEEKVEEKPLAEAEKEEGVAPIADKPIPSKPEPIRTAAVEAEKPEPAMATKPQEQAEKRAVTPPKETTVSAVPEKPQVPEQEPESLSEAPPKETVEEALEKADEVKAAEPIVDKPSPSKPEPIQTAAVEVTKSEPEKSSNPQIQLEKEAASLPKKNAGKPTADKPIQTTKKPIKTAELRKASPPERKTNTSIKKAAIPADITYPVVKSGSEASSKPQAEAAAAPPPKISNPSAPSAPTVAKAPKRVFPDIPVPKTHETPFVKRSQVVAFLKGYTDAYKKGNADSFFSYFTDNATENGKPLKDCEPDYRKIWNKVKKLDYRISVQQTKQVVGSETVSMKGRFDLIWELLDGQSGHSRGEISMDLKHNEDRLVISRLRYQFD